MTRKRNRLQTITTGTCVLFLVAATVLRNERPIIPIIALAGIVLFYRIKRVPFDLLRKPAVWAVVVVPYPAAFLAQSSIDQFSLSSVILGLSLSVRVFNLLMIFNLFNKMIAVEDLLNFFSRFGWKGFGFAVAVAFNVLSILYDRSHIVFQTIRLRGGFRKNPFKACILYCIHMIYTTLLQGEEIIKTAVARGFTP